MYSIVCVRGVNAREDGGRPKEGEVRKKEEVKDVRFKSRQARATPSLFCCSFSGRVVSCSSLGERPR